MKKTNNPILEGLEDLNNKISNLDDNISHTEGLLKKYKEDRAAFALIQQEYIRKHFSEKGDLYLSCKVRYTKEYCRNVSPHKNIDYLNQQTLTVMNISKRDSIHSSGEIIELSDGNFVNIYWIEKIKESEVKPS